MNHRCLRTQRQPLNARSVEGLDSIPSHVSPVCVCMCAGRGCDSSASQFELCQVPDTAQGASRTNNQQERQVQVSHKPSVVVAAAAAAYILGLVGQPLCSLDMLTSSDKHAWQLLHCACCTTPLGQVYILTACWSHPLVLQVECEVH